MRRNSITPKSARTKTTVEEMVPAMATTKIRYATNTRAPPRNGSRGKRQETVFSQLAVRNTPMQQGCGHYLTRPRTRETSPGLCTLIEAKSHPRTLVSVTASLSSHPERASGSLLRIAIREDEFSPAAREREKSQAVQFFRFFLIRPQEYRSRTVPQFRQRFRSLEDMRCIGEFRAVPQVPAWFVQDVNWNSSVKIQRGGLVILAIDHDHIARPKLPSDRLCEIVGRKDGRKRAEGGMYTGQ